MANRRYQLNHQYIGRYFYNISLDEAIKVTNVYTEYSEESSQDSMWCICETYNDSSGWHCEIEDLTTETTKNEWILSCVN